MIRGGENISCLEVEAASYHHPAVAECAGVGLADDKYGEVPGAVVHYRAGDHLTDDELCAYLAAPIAAFKLPARIWVAPGPAPRLGTGKNDTRTFTAPYRARAAGEGERQGATAGQSSQVSENHARGGT